MGQGVQGQSNLGFDCIGSEPYIVGAYARMENDIPTYERIVATNS